MCQLGRRAGNSTGSTGLVLRNGVQVAAAADHSLALTRDGHVYGWGMNAEGQLGLGDEYDKCEGPVLIESLEGKGIVQIATGQNFSVALSRTGELFCAGASDVMQCPAIKGTPNQVFRPVTLPAGIGEITAIRAGSFHTLALTKEGRLVAFGRGRDGQLGSGRVVNGAAVVEGLTAVTSFSAGTWHSAAVTDDGGVWVWGNNGKSQLCDGTTVSKPVPTKVTIAGDPQVARVTAGGHRTLIQTAQGVVYVCGDNAAAPTRVSAPAVTTGVFAAGGNFAAVSVDGCAVKLTGDAGDRVVNPVSLTLCGPRAATPLADVVNPAPRGGASSCWAPVVEEDAAVSPRFAGLRQAMVAAESIIKKNADFLAPLEPVRWRSSMSAGPMVDGGGRLHIKVVPERKLDGTRLWGTECGIIPQLDRIGGAIFQISVFFNTDSILGAAGSVPKLTGTVGGFPEYNGWIVITKDGRLPWVPVTLAEKLDAEGAKRERALADWKRTAAGMKVPDEAATLKTYEALKKTDAAGAEKFLSAARDQQRELERLQREIYPLMTASLERQLQEYIDYRAAQSPEALRSAAVLADTTGEGKRKLDAQVAQMRALPAADQQRASANPQEARAIRQAHTERTAPLVAEALASYDLKNLQAGPAERAISVKRDPAFPDFKDPNRLQLITVSFSLDPNTRNVERRAWQQRVKESFDYAALAALLK